MKKYYVLVIVFVFLGHNIFSQHLGEIEGDLKVNNLRSTSFDSPNNPSTINANSTVKAFGMVDHNGNAFANTTHNILEIYWQASSNRYRIELDPKCKLDGNKTLVFATIRHASSALVYNYTAVNSFKLIGNQYRPITSITIGFYDKLGTVSNTDGKQVQFSFEVLGKP